LRKRARVFNTNHWGVRDSLRTQQQTRKCEEEWGAPPLKEGSRENNGPSTTKKKKIEYHRWEDGPEKKSNNVNRGAEKRNDLVFVYGLGSGDRDCTAHPKRRDSWDHAPKTTNQVLPTKEGPETHFQDWGGGGEQTERPEGRKRKGKSH